jgi:hypothetical protein
MKRYLTLLVTLIASTVSIYIGYGSLSGYFLQKSFFESLSDGKSNTSLKITDIDLSSDQDFPRNQILINTLNFNIRNSVQVNFEVNSEIWNGVSKSSRAKLTFENGDVLDARIYSFRNNQYIAIESLSGTFSILTGREYPIILRALTEADGVSKRSIETGSDPVFYPS